MERFISDIQYCLVAETDEGICGFAFGTVFQKPKSAWNYGYIIWLGVDEKYQSLGFGKKLFSAMQRRFKKAGIRILMVDTSS